MRLLPISALLHDGHDDILSRHEREFLRDAPGDDHWIHHETLADILQRREHDICGQKGLRQRNAAVSTFISRVSASWTKASTRGHGSPVIKRPLKPLHRSGHERILMQHHQVPRQTAHSFAAHRVALVRHGRRANLRRFKRLLHFLHSQDRP